MYQFNGGPGGTYQPAQYSQPDSFNNGQYPSNQPSSGYGQPQNPPMQQQMYHLQTTQSPAPQYPNFSPGQQHQAQNFQGYNTQQQQQQQQPPTRNGSYSGNPQHIYQQQGGYGPGPNINMSQQNAPFIPQPSTPNNFIPRGPQRQASLPNKSNESCYNCGAADHWAQNCSEPRRAVPAGQINRPFKRQKTNGGNVGTNEQVAQQQPPNLQRGWTDPAAAQRSFSMPNNSLKTQAGTFNEPKPLINQQYKKPRMNSASSDGVAPSPWGQQQAQQGSFTPQSAIPNRQNSWSQQQTHQYRYNQNVIGNNYQPWSGEQQMPQYQSTSPAVAPNSQPPWTMHQSQFGNDTSPMMNGRGPIAVDPHRTKTDATSASQATQWSAQNLPTPAPSSVDSQIPSPATSNLNSQLDLHAQQTPSYTDSPEKHQDPKLSVQKAHQCPRAAQAELVANLFSAAAQTPVPNPSPPDAPVNETTSEVEDELEELYGLDFPDMAFAQPSTLTNPAVPVTQPLSTSIDSLGTDIQTPAADVSSIGTSVSKYIQAAGDEDPLRNVQEGIEWKELKSDPVFAKIKANTTTVTFSELIERRQQLMSIPDNSEVDEVGGDGDDQLQETEEERLAREQEERLAALGVTGSAKPVKASPTDVPTEQPVTTRVTGDPGWKTYQRGRPAEHRSVSFESSPSTAQDSRSVSSTSPNPNSFEQQSNRKRAYSGASDEDDGMPGRQDAEMKSRKPRFKQPKVAAAYG
jgi:hypothetical protein